MERKALVLDANILIRAVLGERVRHILEAHTVPNAHTACLVKLARERNAILRETDLVRG